MLLPVEERQELEPEEDDPRWELIKQLVEYKNSRTRPISFTICVCARKTFLNAGKKIRYSG